MKKILIICAAAALTGCGIYKPYTRPEVTTAGLYGSAETADTTTLGDIRWQEMFTDPPVAGAYRACAGEQHRPAVGRLAREGGRGDT